MRKLTLMLFLFLFFAGSLFGQKTVTGKVTDENGNPLSNVSVVIKGSNSGTVTKADGTYALIVPENGKFLVFSAINMEVTEMPIRSQVVNASLVSEIKELAGVVVTGYSVEKKSQFVGSATRMDGKVVDAVPVGAFDQALQGRAPGLQVSSGNGQPGASARITIRGIKSIQAAGAQPLYVIDGIPVSAEDMQTINANDFESITVLKDASAAAVYGSRGALGVIVITTKKGKAGTAPSFTFRTQMGFTQRPAWNKFELMNSSEILEYEARLKVNGTPGWNYSPNNPKYAMLPATSPASDPFAASQARYDFILDSFRNNNMHYPDILFRQGISQAHEINVKGGGQKSRYFVSLGYFDQQGTDLNSRLTRYTTRINLDFTAGKLTIGLNTAMGYSITNYSEGQFLGNSARNPFQMSWRAKPYENPYRSDGTLISGPHTALIPKVIGNALEGVQNSFLRQNQIKAISGLTLAYKILPYLTLKNLFGVEVADDRWQRAINADSYVGSLQAFGAKGIDQEAYEINANLVNTSSLVFNKKIGSGHDVEVGAYFEAIRNYNKGLGFTIYNLDPRISPTGQNAGTFPTAQTQQYATSASSGYGIRSYFATARYTFNDKYTISGNVRRDGASRIINKENREVTTWAAGAIWDAIEEGFMKGQSVLTDFKLRASYGIVPNIGSIPALSYAAGGGLVFVTNYHGAQLPAYSTTTVNAQYANAGITGQAPSAAINDNLKIERVGKLNFGIDLAAWKDRARLSVDYYDEKTTELFANQQIPSTAGFGSGATLSVNAGVMRNKGIEFAVGIDLLNEKNFTLTFGLNHAINSNKIEDLGQVNEIPQGTFIIRKGLPFGSHYTTNYLGADPQTGKPRFETEDGKETIDPGEAFIFAKYGTFLPKHVGGATLDIRFHKITVSALFSYQLKVSRYNNIENWIRRGVGGYVGAVNASRVMLTEQWQNPGDEKFYQAPNYDRGFNSSDIQNAKFIRFRNLNMAYNLPEVNIGKSKLFKSAKFYVQIQNLAIWSPWRGPDPEDNDNISLNEFPNPRMFVTGIDINF